MKCQFPDSEEKGPKLGSVPVSETNVRAIGVRHRHAHHAPAMAFYI